MIEWLKYLFLPWLVLAEQEGRVEERNKAYYQMTQSVFAMNQARADAEQAALEAREELAALKAVIQEVREDSARWMDRDAESKRREEALRAKIQGLRQILSIPLAQLTRLVRLRAEFGPEESWWHACEVAFAPMLLLDPAIKPEDRTVLTQVVADYLADQLVEDVLRRLRDYAMSGQAGSLTVGVLSFDIQKWKMEPEKPS